MFLICRHFSVVGSLFVWFTLFFDAISFSLLWHYCVRCYLAGDFVTCWRRHFPFRDFADVDVATYTLTSFSFFFFLLFIYFFFFIFISFPNRMSLILLMLSGNVSKRVDRARAIMLRRFSRCLHILWSDVFRRHYCIRIYILTYIKAQILLLYVCFDIYGYRFNDK